MSFGILINSQGAMKSGLKAGIPKPEQIIGIIVDNNGSWENLYCRTTGGRVRDDNDCLVELAAPEIVEVPKPPGSVTEAINALKAIIG